MSGPRRWLQLDDTTIMAAEKVAQLPEAPVLDLEVVHGHLPGEPAWVLGVTVDGDVVKARHLPMERWKPAGGGGWWNRAARRRRTPFTDAEKAAHVWPAGAPALQWLVTAR